MSSLAGTHGIDSLTQGELWTDQKFQGSINGLSLDRSGGFPHESILRHMDCRLLCCLITKRRTCSEAKSPAGLAKPPRIIFVDSGYSEILKFKGRT